MSGTSFPANATEALAYLWIQNQDLSDLTPEQLYDKYQEAYNSIHKYKVSKDRKPSTCIIDSPK